MILKSIVLPLGLALFLAGCQSNNISKADTEQVNVSVTNATQKPETPEQVYNRFVDHYAKEIQALDAAGTGSINVCEMKSYDSSMVISYSNEFGKRIILSVYDGHFVNSISMILDKEQANEFLVFIQDALKQSQKKPNIEKLNLGRFAAKNGWVMFTSRRGHISSFWGDDWVDRVLTSIKPEEIFGCITYVEPHL